MTSALDPTAAVTLPPVEGATGLTGEGTVSISSAGLLPIGFQLLQFFLVLVPVLSPGPHSTRAENPSDTTLACWTTQEEAESESSNEEEESGVSPAPSTAEADPRSAPTTNNDKCVWLL